MKNKNKIALVTGGSRGLGRDMALQLAKKGLDVILTYNSQANDAKGVVDQIEKSGQKAAALQLNTGDIKSFDLFIYQLKNLLTNTFNNDHIDFLINNAVVGGYSFLGDVTEDFFDDLLNVHYKTFIF